MDDTEASGSIEASGRPDVSLRPIEPADLPTIFAFESEQAANAMAMAIPRNAEEFDAHWKDILSLPSVVALAVDVDGSLAGSVVSFEMADGRFVGYWIGESFWGKGIATQALSLLLARLPTRPLLARVSSTNAASIRVLLKCGFEEVSREWAEGNARFLPSEVLVMRLTQ